MMMLFANADATPLGIVFLTSVLTAFFAAAFSASFSAISTFVSQRRAFEHRVRLEHEYQIYRDLWEKLFEARRRVGQAGTPTLSDSSNVEYDEEEVVKSFNEFRTAVRKGEPFMLQSVFDHSQKIAESMLVIIRGVGKQTQIEKRQIAHWSSNLSGKDGDSLADIDNERAAAQQEIDRLFEVVARDISNRVSP